MTATRPNLSEAAYEFCRQKKLFAGWTPETLRDYLAFHAAQGTLFLVQTAGQVRGVAIAWRDSERRIWQAACHGRHIFAWQRTDPAGDAIFLAEVVADRTATLAALARQLMAAHPDHAHKRNWTLRRGVLHRLPVNLMHRITTKETYGRS